MHGLMFVLLLSLSPLQKNKPALILLDGKKIPAATMPRVDQKTNMIAFTDTKGVDMLISKNMINWRATALYLPKLAKEVRPQLAQRKTKSRSTKRRSVAITNDALADMGADQGLTKKWDPDNPANRKRPKKPVKRLKSDALIVDIPMAQAYDLDPHMEQDRHVIFYFYAHWSAACKQLTPELENFVHQHPKQIALKKINIVTNESPIAKHHQLSKIPQMILVDTNGKVLFQSHNKRMIQFLKENVVQNHRSDQ